MIKIFGKNKGFTLVEMLIVVVIIGVLATSLIPRLTSVLSNSRDTARLADITSIANGLENYMNNEGIYPSGAHLGDCISKENTNLNVLSKNLILTTLASDPQKNHRNFGTRTQDGEPSSTAGCIGKYGYIGMNGNIGQGGDPNQYGGFMGYVLTFSPENFSKGNMINPTDQRAIQEGKYKYSFDWYVNTPIYKKSLCYGKTDYIPSSVQTIQNSTYSREIMTPGENCKTNNPERIIYARFNEN